MNIKDLDIKITTMNLDVSVGLNAYNAFKSGEFGKSIDLLLQIIDMEPTNWQARMLLAVSYFKTGQYFSAQRIFRYIYDNSTDRELKQKACLALQETTAKIEENSGKAPEKFGRYANQPGVWKGPSTR